MQIIILMQSRCTSLVSIIFYWILNAFFASRHVTALYILLTMILYVHRNHQKGGVKSLLKRLNFKCISCLYAERRFLSSFFYIFFKRFIILKIAEPTVDAIIELMAENSGLLLQTERSVYIKLG